MKSRKEMWRKRRENNNNAYTVLEIIVERGMKGEKYNKHK